MFASLGIKSIPTPTTYFSCINVSIAGPVEMDLEGLMKYKDRAVGGLTSGVESLLKKNKVSSLFFLYTLFLCYPIISILYCYHPIYLPFFRSTMSKDLEKLLTPTRWRLP
jgi:hypothetical protein